MRIMGLDFGTRTVGIALSDNSKIIASGYENYRYKEKDYESVYNHLLEIIEKQKVDEIVIGLPYHMNGDESDKIEIIKEFSKELEKRSGIKVNGIDERLTTVLATKYLLEADISREKRKKVIDQQSAVIILENYMERRKNGR